MCRKGTGLRKNGRTEPSIRSECVDGSKAHCKKMPWTEGWSRSCTRLQEPPHGEHSTSAGSGGSPKRKGTGGADHRLRRQMHQIGDALQVDGNGATLQARRGEVSATDEAGRGREHIDLEEDRVVGEAVRDGLCVREVDRYGRRERRRRRTS